MKKGMFLALFAVLFMFGCAAAQVQTKPEANPVTDQTCTDQTCTIIVDKTQSLDEMIQAGHYDFVSAYITAETFPVEGPMVEMEITPHVIAMNKSATVYEVLTELNKRGLRPATLPELLAFGAKYPSMQKHFPVVALGSIYCGLFTGSIFAPYLTMFYIGDALQRGVEISSYSVVKNDYSNVYYNDQVRFLAVAK